MVPGGAEIDEMLASPRAFFGQTSVSAQRKLGFGAGI
jgi:hypothetical protein